MSNIETNLSFYPRDIFLEAQISHYFDLQAEHKFLHELRQKQTDEHQVQFYSREQVLKFLLEFAAGVKKTQIIYDLGPNGSLVYPGVNLNMEKMLYEAVQKQELNGEAERELAELEGWQKMQQLFQQEDVNHVLQLSPPDNTNLHHGDYGFLFWFQRQDNRVVNHILRYEENYQRLDKSRHLASNLEIPLSNQTNLANSCLAEPKGFVTESATVQTLLEALGFAFDQRASLLEQALLTDKIFLNLLARYQQMLDRPHLTRLQQEAVLGILSQLYQLTQNRATQIGLLNSRPQEMFLPLIFQGGSCPVIGGGFGFYDFSSYLLGEPFTCPNCGYISYVPVGNKCPHCKITKEEWKKKQEKETGDSFNLCD